VGSSPTPATKERSRTTKKNPTDFVGFFILKPFEMETEFVVYLLYSKKFDKTYTGYTSNLIERFKSHNFLGKKGFTLRYRPWVVVLVEPFKSEFEARNREKSLKSGQGRIWVRREIIPLYK
jgi:putative endonuclease